MCTACTALVPSRGPALAEEASGEGDSPFYTVETAFGITGLEKGLGAEKRTELSRAVTLMKQGKHDEANAVLDGVISFFEGKTTDPEATYVCVANREEYEAYLRDHAEEGKVIWLDWAFGEAIHRKAFMASARKDWAAALRLLDREIALAPYIATAHCERGYILNAQRKPLEALHAYMEAFKLSERFVSASGEKAAALRGIGFALIELGDLAAARKMYEMSLEIDPDSKVALRELEYIKKAEEAAGETPAK